MPRESVWSMLRPTTSNQREVVMRFRVQLAVGLVALASLAACGGGPGATQAPGGGGSTAGTPATQAPVATLPGGGGGGNDGTGKVTYTVTGSVQKNGELPFLGFGSRFDKAGATGLALNFTESEGGAIFSITEINGVHAISLIDEAHGLSWAACETYEINVTGTNATGRFECSQGFGTSLTDGAVVSGIKITGTIDAHA
jgi:hypothetical protein